MKKKKTPKTYLVFYNESCCSSLRSFKSLSEARKFVLQFLNEHQDNKDDNWIDFIVEGLIRDTYEGFESWKINEVD